MSSAFDGRPPTGNETIEMGMFDLEDRDTWIPLGTTRAWCWQQGCMLQWVPGSDRLVIWNDREGDRFVSRVCDITTREVRTLPAPVYTLSPDGKTALSLDFARLEDCRPGYGYAGLPDPRADEPAPREVGIWRLDLQTGERTLIVPLGDMPGIAVPGTDLRRPKHWFNHLLFNRSGSRFFILNRWREIGAPVTERNYYTRAVTADADGGNRRVLGSGDISHFIWRDDRTLLIWARHASHGPACYHLDETDGSYNLVDPEHLDANGHYTYLAGQQWVLSDTCGNRDLFLYHEPTRRKIELGQFPYHADKPRGAASLRCDLHPRSSQDRRYVTVDSVHEGPDVCPGRQLYLLDLADVDVN